MKLILARCSVEYSGRLSAYLPPADRLIMLKADGSCLIHSESGSYKPLNWMMAPTRITITPNGGAEENATASESPIETWTVESAKTPDRLTIHIYELYSEMERSLGIDPGLQKDGVESHLQKLLAEQLEHVLGPGWQLVRREYPTPIGPVDHLVQDPAGKYVIIEVKRRGEIDGVEQLTRYLDLLCREPKFKELRGIYAAQEIRHQARTLAEDRGIECLILDYEQLRGLDDRESRLF